MVITIAATTLLGLMLLQWWYHLPVMILLARAHCYHHSEPLRLLLLMHDDYRMLNAQSYYGVACTICEHLFVSVPKIVV